MALGVVSAVGCDLRADGSRWPLTRHRPTPSVDRIWPRPRLTSLAACQPTTGESHSGSGLAPEDQSAKVDRDEAPTLAGADYIGSAQVHNTVAVRGTVNPSAPAPPRDAGLSHRPQPSRPRHVHDYRGHRRAGTEHHPRTRYLGIRSRSQKWHSIRQGSGKASSSLSARSSARASKSRQVVAADCQGVWCRRDHCTPGLPVDDSHSRRTKAG